MSASPPAATSRACDKLVGSWSYAPERFDQGLELGELLGVGAIGLRIGLDRPDRSRDG